MAASKDKDKDKEGGGRGAVHGGLEESISLKREIATRRGVVPASNVDRSRMTHTCRNIVILGDNVSWK